MKKVLASIILIGIIVVCLATLGAAIPLPNGTWIGHGRALFFGDTDRPENSTKNIQLLSTDGHSLTAQDQAGNVLAAIDSSGNLAVTGSISPAAVGTSDVDINGKNGIFAGTVRDGVGQLLNSTGVTSLIAGIISDGVTFPASTKLNVITTPASGTAAATLGANWTVPTTYTYVWVRCSSQVSSATTSPIPIGAVGQHLEFSMGGSNTAVLQTSTSWLGSPLSLLPGHIYKFICDGTSWIRPE